MVEVLFFSESLSLGQKVRITRVAKRWTQSDLAYEADVPQGCVSALERDLRIYPAGKKRILKVLGLDSPEAAHE